MKKVKIMLQKTFGGGEGSSVHAAGWVDSHEWKEAKPRSQKEEEKKDIGMRLEK